LKVRKRGVWGDQSTVRDSAHPSVTLRYGAASFEFKKKRESKGEK